MSPLPVVLAQAAEPPLRLLMAESPTWLFGFLVPLPLWQVLLALAAGGIALHLFLRTVLRRYLRRISRDLAVAALRTLERVLAVWIVLLLGNTTLAGLNLMGRPWAHDFVVPASYVLFVVTVFWAATSLLFLLMGRWAERDAGFRSIHAPLRWVLKTIIVLVAAATLLAYFEVDITALIATGAVGGVAVAFALKDTLENFFAGLHLMADRPINEGDMVQLHETGDRGTVVKVGWRSTRVRTLDNNLLVVPNTKLASGIVTNLSAADSRVFVRMPVGVAYGSDPDVVTRILLESVGACIDRVPGLDAASAPAAWLHPGFGPSSLDFTVGFFVGQPAHLWAAQDAVRREILRRFAAEGVRIPYPTTTVLHRPAG